MKGGVAVNDDAGLETEADVMGARAATSGMGAAISERPGYAGGALSEGAHGTVQRATWIDGEPGNYGYDKNKHTDVAGLRAFAYLDPLEPAHGSAPSGSALDGAMTDLKTLGYQHMIKGHLINGQVGGPGVAANVFPITSQANSLHKIYAENLIKQEVTNRKTTGKGVFYSVEVTDAGRSSQSPDASFTCEAYEWDVSKGHDMKAVDTTHPILPPLDIESKPVMGSTGSGVVTPLLIGIDALGKKFKHPTNEAISINDKNAALGAGWGEVGSGKGDVAHDWSHVSKNIPAG